MVMFRHCWCWRLWRRFCPYGLKPDEVRQEPQISVGSHPAQVLSGVRALMMSPT